MAWRLLQVYWTGNQFSQWFNTSVSYQDQDGSHIKGLLINFFHHNWPSLLKHTFLEEFITPIVKVTEMLSCLIYFIFSLVLFSMVGPF